MFIKPIDVTILPNSGAIWKDHAGNTHFILQSKKKDTVMRSLLSGLTTLSVTTDAYKRSLAEYDFRILLRLAIKKVDYVVAVDDTFEKIHVVQVLIT